MFGLNKSGIMAEMADLVITCEVTLQLINASFERPESGLKVYPKVINAPLKLGPPLAYCV